MSIPPTDSNSSEEIWLALCECDRQMVCPVTCGKMVKCLSLTEQYSLWVHCQWCFGWLLPILPLSCRSVHRIHAADQSQTAPKASTVASNLPSASAFVCWRVDGAQTSLGCFHLLPCSPGIEKNMRSANTSVYTNKVFKAVPKKYESRQRPETMNKNQLTVCWVTKIQRDHFLMAVL